MSICRIEEAIWKLLTSASSVTDIVGTRIHHDAAQIDDTFPVAVVMVQRTVPVRNLSATVGVAVSTIEIVGVAESRTDAHDLGEAIRKTLDNYHGTVTLTDGDTCFIHCIAVDHGLAVRQQAPDGNDIGLSSAYQTFTLTHELGV